MSHPHPPARASRPSRSRPYATEPVPLMSAIPASSPAASRTSRESCTTVTRDPGSRSARRRSSRLRAAGTSAPALPAQQASAPITPSPPSRAARRSATVTAGSAATLAPGPSASATIRSPSTRRARLDEPPMSSPSRRGLLTKYG